MFFGIKKNDIYFHQVSLKIYIFFLRRDTSISKNNDLKRLLRNDYLIFKFNNTDWVISIHIKKIYNFCMTFFSTKPNLFYEWKKTQFFITFGHFLNDHSCIDCKNIILNYTEKFQNTLFLQKKRYFIFYHLTGLEKYWWWLIYRKSFATI